jgi:tetratricopeptide (TPR) repeat protein
MSAAVALYREAIDSGHPMNRIQKQAAYNYIIADDFDNEEKKDEIFDLCIRAYEEFPEHTDFCYYYARKLYLQGDYGEAWEKLIECEALLKNESGVADSSFIVNKPMMLFFQMVLTAEELGDLQNVIHYATLTLKEDKYQPQMLAPYIGAFRRSGYETSDDEIFELLGKIYDFKNTKDKLTVMRAAKTAGNMELVAKVLSALTQDEYRWLTEVSE